MKNSQQNESKKRKSVHCHFARFLGIFGILFALFVLGYVFLEISTQPLRAIPVTVLLGLMILGVLFDIVRLKKEGFGGLIAVVAGVVYFLFFILTIIMGWSWDKGGELVELFASLPLFVAGMLFYLCGKKRKKVNP